MADNIPTTYMNLPNPVPGSSQGPQYATDQYNCFVVVDQHNHSVGSGQQISPNGLNINADLSFQINNAIQLRSAIFSPQASPITNTGTDIGSLYVSGNELYYNDVTGGNQVQLTANGTVNATSSGISSGTASAAFSASVLVVKSTSTSGANVEMQSAVLTNSGNLTNTLTLQAPTLASSITETLPTPPASVTSIMQMDSSGTMSALLTVDASTINIVANQLVATQVSGASQGEVNTGTSTTKFVSPSTLAGRQSVALFTTAGAHTWTPPAGCSQVLVFGRGGAGGGGGGGAGATSGGGGGGGGGVVVNSKTFGVTPGVQVSITVGAGGAGGAGAASINTKGGDGSSGSNSSFGSLVFRNIGTGGTGGDGVASTGAGGAGGSFVHCFGGSGGLGGTTGTTNNGATGGASTFGNGGAGGAVASGQGGGGGGGGGGDTIGGAGSDGNSAAAGAAGTGGGGGGGGGGTRDGVTTGGDGGAGSPGFIGIVYLEAITTNSNT